MNVLIIMGLISCLWFGGGARGGILGSILGF
jgi:hypothetical protein